MMIYGVESAVSTKANRISLRRGEPTSYKCFQIIRHKPGISTRWKKMITRRIQTSTQYTKTLGAHLEKTTTCYRRRTRQWEINKTRKTMLHLVAYSSTPGRTSHRIKSEWASSYSIHPKRSRTPKVKEKEMEMNHKNGPTGRTPISWKEFTPSKPTTMIKSRRMTYPGKLFEHLENV